MGVSLEKISNYLDENARLIDLALFKHYFENGSAEDVLSELKTYQNDDGGFGNAIGSDLRFPHSTAIATWSGFQYIKELDVDSSHEIILNAFNYLVNTYNEEICGWQILPPEVDDYPHAPWWDYKTAIEHFSWANPNTEILGLLIKYGSKDVFGNIIVSMKEKALEHIHKVDPSDFHDVFNYKALYELCNDELRSSLKELVEKLILNAVTTDSSQWGNYVATPLKFIASPEDPFIHLFDEQTIQKNLDYLESTIVDEDHWEPNWDWSGNYPEDWKKAKIEWSGHLTVKNLKILKDFSRL